MDVSELMEELAGMPRDARVIDLDGYEIVTAEQDGPSAVVLGSSDEEDE